MKQMVNRQDILEKAIHDCFVEMYEKSQPAADWDNIVQEYRDGKIGKNETIYDRHYLSYEEYSYILEKYIKMYNMEPQWKSNIELLENYLTNGGTKDKYIPEHTDENGFTHPGYRGYEKVAPLNKHIEHLLVEYHNGQIIPPGLSDAITNKVMELIKNCKDFYRFDREEEQFRIAVGLGASPCTNKETVKKWWKDNYDVDIEIIDHNPKLFWYEDEGYTDEDLAYEFEDLGENWREELDKQWKEEVEQKEREKEERLKKLQEEINNEAK